MELTKGFKNSRWMKYAFSVTRYGAPENFNAYGAYLCRSKTQLAKVEFIYVRTPTLPGGKGAQPIVNAQSHSCL